MSGTGSAPFSRRGVTGGFTLIEMLVVLAISALIAGLGFPRVEAMIDTQRFRSEATGMALALTETRATALREGRTTRFAIASNGYVPAGGVAHLLPAGTHLSATAPVVAFYDDGTGDAATIVMTGQRDRRQFTVSPDTGTIAVTQ